MIYLGSSPSINAAMEEWGALLLQRYGKASGTIGQRRSISLDYLGYYTDNGAYYYYNTEPSKTYEQTMLGR